MKRSTTRKRLKRRKMPILADFEGTQREHESAAHQNPFFGRQRANPHNRIVWNARLDGEILLNLNPA